MLYSPGCCLLSTIGTFPGGGGVQQKIKALHSSVAKGSLREALLGRKKLAISKVRVGDLMNTDLDTNF